MISNLTVTAKVSYHWRTLKGDNRLTRYFYSLMQRLIQNRICLAEAILLAICKYAKIVPLHLYICVGIETVLDDGTRCRTDRYYGVSDGNADETDGALIGRNNTPALLRFTAYSPGSWAVQYRKATSHPDSHWSRLDWKSSGVPLKDIRTASKRLKLTAAESDIVHEQVCNSLSSDDNSVVSHCESIAVTEQQLCAMDALVRRCQPHFHYKLLGNNCQNVASDVVQMLRQPTYMPNWVPQNIHAKYLAELRV